MKLNFRWLCNFIFILYCQFISTTFQSSCGPTHKTSFTQTQERPTLAAGDYISCSKSTLNHKLTEWSSSLRRSRDKRFQNRFQRRFIHSNMGTLLQLAFRCEKKTVLHITTFSSARKTCNFQLRNGNGRKSNVIDRFWSVWVEPLCILQRCNEGWTPRIPIAFLREFEGVEREPWKFIGSWSLEAFCARKFSSSFKASLHLEVVQVFYSPNKRQSARVLISKRSVFTPSRLPLDANDCFAV